MTSYPRNCCPACGQPVSASRYIWRAWIWARWSCKSCGTLLRFDFRTRLMLGLFVGLWQLIFFGLAFLCIWFHFPIWSYFVWGIPYFCLAIYFTCHFDRVIVAEPPKTQESHVLSPDA